MITMCPAMMVLIRFLLIDRLLVALILNAAPIELRNTYLQRSAYGDATSKASSGIAAYPRSESPASGLVLHFERRHVLK
jgi:hypothetical protein